MSFSVDRAYPDFDSPRGKYIDAYVFKLAGETVSCMSHPLKSILRASPIAHYQCEQYVISYKTRTLDQPADDTHIDENEV